MKNLLYTTFLLLTLLFVGCNDDNSESIFVQDSTLSELTANSFNFTDNGGSENFSVKCAVMPTATSDAEWLIVNRTGSANKIHSFSVTASSNTTEEVRTGIITITAGKNKETITITQEAGTVSIPEEPVEPNPGESENLLGLRALDIAKDIIAGWNIGNTLEAIGGETAWGNPLINEAYIDGIKAAGFNAVRIPCSWDQNIADKSTNTIKPEWLNRVDEVVGMVVSRGMYAIVNIHWDGGWLENNIGSAVKDNLLEKQKTLWTQIANKLGHYNEMLMFAGLNEPNADEVAGANVLLQYEQAFIDAVRATGGNNSTRTLIFQGPHTDISKTYDNFKTNPSDPAGDGYLMAEIHYYDPYQYTIMEGDESWGKVFWFWGAQFHQPGHSRNANWGEEDWMKTQFDKMKNQFVNKGIPVIIGEYGAYPQEDKHYAADQTEEEKEIVAQSRAYFYNCVHKFAKERGLIPFVWDTGELIKRTDGTITKQYMMDAIMEGAASVSYPY